MQCVIQDLGKSFDKVILHTLISKNQFTFVLERSITDNVLIVFEVIHCMQRKNVGDDGEIAIKLDISKVYDKVDWAYLKAWVLVKKGKSG